MSLEAIARRIEAQIPGWTPAEQLLVLATLSATTASLGGDVIEIGSWCGRSTVALACGLAGSAGVVHAVDIFPTRDDWRQNADGTWSCFSAQHGRTISACVDPTVWDEPFREHIAPLYDRFGRDGVRRAFDQALADFGVADRVIAHRGEGRDFRGHSPAGLECRLAFLDGDHGYDSLCADLDVVEAYLKPGGWLCLDDAFTVYGSIDRAIQDRVIHGPYEDCRQITRKMFIARRTA